MYNMYLQYKDGYISEVKKMQCEIKLQLKDQRYYKQMINYFSIGVDAHIGFGLIKNRTSNKCCNKCVYSWEGFKKMFVRTPKVNQSIENIHNLNKDYQLENGLLQKSINQIVIPGNPVNLFCLNINSYAGGLKNIWLNAQQNQVKSYSNLPSISDGLLEILSFNSILGLGSERLIRIIKNIFPNQWLILFNYKSKFGSNQFMLIFTLRQNMSFDKQERSEMIFLQQYYFILHNYQFNIDIKDYTDTKLNIRSKCFLDFENPLFLNQIIRFLNDNHKILFMQIFLLILSQGHQMNTQVHSESIQDHLSIKVYCKYCYQEYSMNIMLITRKDLQ